MDDRDETGKFIKGKSGNPEGRPKNAISINAELRKLLATKDKKTGKQYVESLALKIFTDALKGNDRLIIELWQQMEGKAPQNINVGGQEDSPIEIRINHVKPGIDKDG